MSHECPRCGAVFDNIRGIRTHYSQMHPESGPLEADPDEQPKRPKRPIGPDERLVFCKSVLLDKRLKRWVDSNITNFSEWARMKIDEEMKQQELEALE